MYKLLLLCSLALCFAVTGVATSASAQDPDTNNPLIWKRDRGRRSVWFWLSIPAFRRISDGVSILTATTSTSPATCLTR